MTTPDHVNREKARKLLEPVRKAWDEELVRGILESDREILAKLK